MDRYQLAKLVQWSGKLDTRKRLQKVVSLLKAAGADIKAEYTLHLYGPYSSDVAQRTDEMAAAGFLLEEVTTNAFGGQTYSYSLPEHVERQLSELDKQASRQAFLQHETLARKLLNEPALRLELASTVAHIYQAKLDWTQARIDAAAFKKRKPDCPEMLDAERLAREVIEGSAN